MYVDLFLAASLLTHGLGILIHPVTLIQWAVIGTGPVCYKGFMYDTDDIEEMISMYGGYDGG